MKRTFYTHVVHSFPIILLDVIAWTALVCLMSYRAHEREPDELGSDTRWWKSSISVIADVIGCLSSRMFTGWNVRVFFFLWELLSVVTVRLVIVYEVLETSRTAKELQNPYGNDLNDMDLDMLANSLVADVLFVYRAHLEWPVFNRAKGRSARVAS